MARALRFLEGQPVQPWRWHWFVALFAACGCALFAATWRLWTPQQRFPQVPFLSWAGEMPSPLEWLALAAIFASLLVTFAIAVRAARRAGRKGAGVTPGRLSGISSAALLVFVLAATILILGNQHRLQPWAYQFVVIALVLAVMPPPRAFVLLRWLAVSIYLWSAIAKMDHSFVHTLGQQFLAALVGLAGMSIENWPPAASLAGAWAFPLGELLVGVGFCLPLQRHALLRRAVLTLAVAMHVALILLLSPLGLDHKPGVMLWNVWFILQAVLLFGFPATNPDGGTDSRPSSPESPPTMTRETAEVFIEFLVAAVIFLPVLHLFGRFDHWPAWGLYAPRNSRALLFVHRSAIDDAPPELQRYLESPADSGEWAQLRLDRWSLEILSVPIYPEDRFQLGAAESVIRELGLQQSFQIVVESPADRLTGMRRRRTLRNLSQLDAFQRTFLLNAQPRRAADQ